MVAIRRHADPLRTSPPGPHGVRKIWNDGDAKADRCIPENISPGAGREGSDWSSIPNAAGLGSAPRRAEAECSSVQWTDAATGRKQREPLGAWGAITLAQARAAARARLGRVAQGINPATERTKAKAEDQRERAAAAAAREEARFTLDALISQWAKLHLAGKRLRYATEAERALRVAFASHLARPASALTHAAVTAVLDKLAGDGKAPIAGRTLAYGRACYGWAMKRRRLVVNPFAGLPVIQGANPSRDRVLTDAEVGAVWRASGAMGLPFGPLCGCCC